LPGLHRHHPPPLKKRGVKLFTARDYVIDEMPTAVKGLPFLRTSIEKLEMAITKPGALFALTPTDGVAELR
jgi:hypothetical protein